MEVLVVAYLLELLILSVLLGLIPAVIAQRKGYGFGGWWLYGALLWIVALPHALWMGENEESRRTCPHCRTTIDREASVCPQCARDVPPAPPPAAPEPYPKPAELEPVELSPKQLAGGLVLLLVVVGVSLVSFMR